MFPVRTAMAAKGSGASTASDVTYIAPPVSDGALALASPHTALGIGLAISPLLRARAMVADYVALTKPGIMTLLLGDTLRHADRRARRPALLACRGNDARRHAGRRRRECPQLLHRPRHRRPDGSHAQSRDRGRPGQPDAALAFGITLTVASVLVLGVMANWTAAALALAGNLFYVFVYTKWLKRSTPYNIVIGGAAGATARWLGGGDRRSPAGLGSLRHHLRLDAAPFLGAGAAQAG